MKLNGIYKIFFGALLIIFSQNVSAQSADNPDGKRHNFSFYLGVGPNVYFNNLVVGKDYVNAINYSISGRIMWEPQYLLSLGIESGYNRLYTLDFGELSDV